MWSSRKKTTSFIVHSKPRYLCKTTTSIITHHSQSLVVNIVAYLHYITLLRLRKIYWGWWRATPESLKEQYEHIALIDEHKTFLAESMAKQDEIKKEMQEPVVVEANQLEKMTQIHDTDLEKGSCCLDIQVRNLDMSICYDTRRIKELEAKYPVGLITDMYFGYF